jgi:hypothetical protein
MNVIGHAINAECDSTEFTNNAAKISVEIRLDLRCDLWRPETRAEDEMDEYVRGRMPHVLTPLGG